MTAAMRGYRYPVFNYNNCCNPFSIGSPQNAYIAERAASIAHANLGPYGWVSDYGGTVQLNTFPITMEPSRAMALKRMMYDPTYIPSMDQSLYTSTLPSTAEIQQKITEARERGAAEAAKSLLKIKYDCALQGVTRFITEVKQLLKTEGIPDADKQEIEKIQKQAEDLKKKLEDYATASKDKDVKTATEEVEAMAGELVTLKKSATDLAKKIAENSKNDAADGSDAQGTQGADGADGTQGAQGAQEVDGTDGTQGSQGTQGADGADGTQGADGTGGTQGSQGVQGADGTEGAQNPDEQLTPELARKSYNEELKPYINNVLLKDKNLSAKDKKAVLDKCKEFCKAKGQDKVRIYQELYNLLNEVAQRTAEAGVRKAAEVCAEIYIASAGIDWSGFAEGDGEKKLKDIVFNKINKDNIIGILDAWTKGDYNSKTGDDCLLDTLFGEFYFNTSGIKTKMTNHILKCLEEAAKAKGLYNNDLMAQIAVIKGELNSICWDYKKIFKSFNNIHAILTNIEEETTQQTQQQAQQ